MGLFFGILVATIFLFLYIDKLLFHLYALQLNGYSIKSIYVNHMVLIKTSIKYHTFSLVVFVLLLIVFFAFKTNIFLYELITYFIWFIVSVYCLFGFKSYKKIKYTNRMIRLLVCNLFLCLLFMFLIFYWFDNAVILFLFCAIFFTFLFTLFSSCILLPIEKLISRYYKRLARFKISSFHNLIKIGITGSYGKTSTKVILNSILNEHYNCYATEKSFNTPLGVSRSINYGLTDLHEIFICEMGAKAVGDINELCQFVDVDIGIVTSVGRQHLQTFGTIDNVYTTKKELPDYLSGKMCVFNLNNFYTKLMYDDYIGDKVGVCVIGNNERIKHSILKTATRVFVCRATLFCFIILYQNPNKEVIFAKKICADEFGLKFKVYQGKNYLFECCSKLLGIHNITNILLSIAVALRLKVPVNKIQAGVLKVNCIDARLEKMICSNGAIAINNGYNSNLDSSKSTLAVLDLFDRCNKIVITPGLIECGDMYKDNVAFGELVSKHATEVIVVKEINKKAITDGLLNKGFNPNKITYVNSINDCKKIIDSADKSYIFLIENDLPDNFR